ncbi:p-loop containing nucleoside triphosphate hydrolase [Fusarium flagelliforme]|uniref:p-loop containing nucleoside triphosphate hydrolase n=1 Tax=Fusarium flagelliforme TaxID=2675880 RepID=A0A395MZS0_9HYPO|nr:p-loop containing nucleoside triphosphate hydrolase [Fusarium flagelliforme]
MAVPSKLVAADSVVEPSDSSQAETLPADGSVSEQTEVDSSVTDISSKILDVIFDYALNKFNDSKERLEAGRPKFLAVVSKFVTAGSRVDMCLPAFPFKSANKAYKVFGILPDKAEELALGRLNTMCARIKEIYPPGAQCIIISDGIVYNDLLSISDRDTWAYGQALRKMSSAKFEYIGFSRIKDLIDFPMPPDMKEIAYVANATNFRRAFLNRFGKDDIDIDQEIKDNPDTMMTYLGYRRFLESDLKHIFPVGNGRGANEYRRDVRYLAKQMLIRGYAFAGAVKNGFPNYLRLSIHHSTGEHKISMSLLDTNTGFTTPWHCCVARMANGEWTSAPMGEYLKDPNMKVVHENGRPSYFQETITDTKTEEVLAAQPVQMPQVAVQTMPEQVKSTILSPFTGEEEERLTVLAKSISGELKQQDNKPLNPFSGSDNPALDPHSSEFSIAAWLQAVMSITSRDPEKYPHGVAGVSYKDLSAHGVGEATDYQKTFGNYPLELVKFAKKLMSQGESAKIQILKDFEGLVKSGEMLLVLGRPGSGCSTFLKTISGETSGFKIGEESQLNYQGIPQDIMHKDFRGECIYQAENDSHFPQLTVGQTLEFAGRARVGNDFIRGVSGGERKRVSIAEVAIGGSTLQCWDNSTRGLDSATALDFVRTLRTSTKFTGATALVSVYQASQSIYDTFDKVVVLYEGRQIYFGNIHAAKDFFVNLGFECAPRQVTADFLTSLTNPLERRVRPGFEGKAPSTPDEFAAVWKRSQERNVLLQEIDVFNKQYPIGGPSLDAFRRFRKAIKASSQRIKSPYVLSIPQQIALCVQRAFQSLRSNATLVIIGSLFNAIMALVVGSIFYNLPNTTDSLYSRGALLFFGILLAAFASALERPIVEKHKNYAFYHPFTEAVASMICDLPNKILTSLTFNLVLYFMTNLRRTPGHFFVFLLFTFTCTLTMSMYFRCIGALSRSLPEALAPASLFCLALAIYTGFSIPIKDMVPWFRWLNYLNPVAYAFEALMINEVRFCVTILGIFQSDRDEQFHDRTIECSRFVPEGPGYEGITSVERICATTGAAAGASVVDGDAYLSVNFGYHHSHMWRNFGIMLALMIFGCAVYLVATEYISAKKSKGEVLIFRRSNMPYLQSKSDEETASFGKNSVGILANEKTALGPPVGLEKQTAVFQWSDVTYDIKVKKETRRLLHQLDGWVKPGTLTALMGITGAGKTTLLDVLANRTSVGVVDGEFLVNGRPRDTGFQRKTGYVQQQDLHLSTTTVREALTFSALLRQPRATPRKEKLQYVEQVIDTLEMHSYADAIVGRKRLTIGVELAAKPALLLFLDEPTSGLDSQTAWSICQLLRRLADNGQAILCTIHQPSAHLFQSFDRLLFLAMGGKTMYFGDIGPSSKIMTGYFERNGARPCGEDENPAEWMLEITGSGSEQDWPSVWNDSLEREAVKAELAMKKMELSQLAIPVTGSSDVDSLRPFAAPFVTQLFVVLKRVFQQYWRTPSYLYSKVALCLFSALFIGFSFWQLPNSLHGLQNQMYAIFMLLVIFTNVCSQIMPHYDAQRALYQSRESPSKTYSWQVFVLSNLLVEIPWNSLSAILIFLSWYYPIGLRHNALEANEGPEREALMFLFILAFMNFAGTFTNMVLSAVGNAEAAGNLTNLLHSLSLIFCGVLVSPEAMPGFWIFMYRVSPFTYFFSGVLSVGLGNSHISCSTEEYLHFSPPPTMNCSAYLAPYIEAFDGYLTPDSMGSTSECVFCSGNDTNIFLETVSADYDDRWRNFGIFWVYIIFNMAAAPLLFWLTKVPKGEMSARKKDTGKMISEVELKDTGAK